MAYRGWHPKTEDNDINMTDDTYATFQQPQYFAQNFNTPANLPPPPPQPSHAIQTQISTHVQGAFSTGTHHPHCAMGGGFPPPVSQACVASQQIFVPNTFRHPNPSCEFKFIQDVRINDSFDSNMSGVPELQSSSGGRYDSNILKYGLITLPDGRQVYSKQAIDEISRQQQCAGRSQVHRNYHSADAANPRIARHHDVNSFGPPSQAFVMDVDLVQDDRRTACAMPFPLPPPNSQSMLPPPPRRAPLPPPPPQHSHQSPQAPRHQHEPLFPRTLDDLPPIPMEKTPVVPHFTPRPQQGVMPGGIPVGLPPAAQAVISMDRGHHGQCVQFSSNITSEVHRPPITTQLSLPSNNNIFEASIMPSVGQLPTTASPEYQEQNEESTRRNRVPCTRRSPTRSTCGGIRKQASRKKTNVACTNCVKAKAGCGVERPCKRCIRLKKDKCVDRPLNPKSKTKRPKRGQSRSCSASPLSEDHSSERQSPAQTMGVFGRGSPSQQNCEQINTMISPPFFMS